MRVNMGERQIYLRILYLCLIPVAIWELLLLDCSHALKSNGIQEVVGSDPVRLHQSNERLGRYSSPLRSFLTPICHFLETADGLT